MAAPRLIARSPRPRPAPPIRRDPDVVAGFLEDAAHVGGGHASGVAFPADEAEVAALVRAAPRVLAVGAQSSLTGGATPRGEVVLSTRALTGIEFVGPDRVRVGAGVTLLELQQTLARHGLYYPPVPTYTGAFVGGTIATNAAGAATYKYGSTRAWVEGLTVVLADGSVLDLRRGEQWASEGLEIVHATGTVARVTLPSYVMPRVPKNSAGYYSAAPDGAYDPVDLFIGSEGTLGVVVSATLRVIARPRQALALVPCRSDAAAIELTTALLAGGDEAIAGIEYVDAEALAELGPDAFTRAGVPGPEAGSILLFVHAEDGVERIAAVLDAHGVAENAIVAPAEDSRGAARLLELREAVPAAVNSRVADAKAHVHGGIEKTAADMIVPFERLADSLAVYRRAFARRGLRHAIWGHFSDGNLHPNVIPRALDDVAAGKDAILEIGRAIVAMGGSPLAEHGVGRSAVKQALLRQLYGEAGVDEMRAIKRALDPGWKLAPGVLFDA